MASNHVLSVISDCNPMDCNLPGSSVHGISQARMLEWIAISFSRESFWLRDWTCVSCMGRQFLYELSYKGSPRILKWVADPFFCGSSWPRNWTGFSCIAGGFFTNWAIREANTIPLVNAVAVKPRQLHLTLCNPMDCLGHQGPLPMDFSRQEYWSGLPCPFPGDPPNSEIELRLL